MEGILYAKPQPVDSLPIVEKTLQRRRPVPGRAENPCERTSTHVFPARCQNRWNPMRVFFIRNRNFLNASMFRNIKSDYICLVKAWVEAGYTKWGYV